jgi:hypothetical protein
VSGYVDEATPKLQRSAISAAIERGPPRSDTGTPGRIDALGYGLMRRSQSGYIASILTRALATSRHSANVSYDGTPQEWFAATNKAEFSPAKGDS